MFILRIIASPIILLPLLLPFVKSAQESEESSMINLDDNDDSDEDFNVPKVTIGRPSKDICPKLTLLNGRVRLRSRGRVVKFICRPGFQMLGKRYSSCIRGRWNTELPICIARGCQMVDSPAYGKVSEGYRGGLLVFECNPGYVIEGSSTLFCNGVYWNSSAPKCRALEKPTLTCDFEREDLCGWTHDPLHDFDWKRHNFGTPSGHVGTGPSHDHTFGDGKDGYYMYLEASSPRKENDTARLYSPVYPSTISDGGCFRFWYHMYGATTGFLRVFIKPASFHLQELTPQFYAAGEQGNRWLEGAIPIKKLNESFQIVIEGIRGTSYVSDSAIDDVALTFNGECSTSSTPSTISDVSTGVTKSASDFAGPEESQKTGSASSTYQTSESGITDTPSQTQSTWMFSQTTGPSSVTQGTWKMASTALTEITNLTMSTTTLKATTSQMTTTKQPIMTVTVTAVNTTTTMQQTTKPTNSITKATTTTAKPTTITKATSTTTKPATSTTKVAITTTKPTPSTTKAISTTIRLTPTKTATTQTTKQTTASTSNLAASTTKPITLTPPTKLVTLIPTTLTKLTMPSQSTTTRMPIILSTKPVTVTPTTLKTDLTKKSLITSTIYIDPTTKVPTTPFKTTSIVENPSTGNPSRQTLTTHPTTMILLSTSSTTSDAGTTENVDSFTKPKISLPSEEPTARITKRISTKRLPPWLYLTTTKGIALPNDRSKPESQQQTDIKTPTISTATGLGIGALCIVIIASAIAVLVLRRRRLNQRSLSEDSDVRYLKDDEVRVEFVDSNGKITYEDNGI